MKRPTYTCLNFLCYNLSLNFDIEYVNQWKKEELFHTKKLNKKYFIECSLFFANAFEVSPAEEHKQEVYTGVWPTLMFSRLCYISSAGYANMFSRLCNPVQQAMLCYRVIIKQSSVKLKLQLELNLANSPIGFDIIVNKTSFAYFKKVLTLLKL